MHVPPFPPALASELFIHELDDVMVLGVNREDASVLRELLHRELHPPEVQTARLSFGMWGQQVRREDLDARKALLDRLRNLVEDLEIECAEQGDVKGIVHVRLTLPPRHPFLQGAPKIDAMTDEAEVNMRGRAATRETARVLFGAQRIKRILRVHGDVMGQMGVGLDSSWDHNLPLGLDRSASLSGKRANRSDAHDLFSLNTDLPSPDALSRDHHVPTDHEIEHPAPPITPSGSWIWGSDAGVSHCLPAGCLG